MQQLIRTDQPLLKNRAKITRTIAKFWNQTSDGWLKIWGTHIHHGYYEDINNPPTVQNAQEILIDKLAHEVAMPQLGKVLDAGCGMGGSACYLAEKYGAIVSGISLSQRQIEIAAELAKQRKIKNVQFSLEDALSLRSFPHENFDLIWSLESCEQFSDKSLFIEKAYNKLKPGGKLLLATWCSSADEYQHQDARFYQRICHAFDLPYMPTIEHYQQLLLQQGFKIEKKLDWTNQVRYSWKLGNEILKKYSFLQLLRLGGIRGLKFARQLGLMQQAFYNDRVRYGVLVATKI